MIHTIKLFVPAPSDREELSSGNVDRRKTEDIKKDRDDDIETELTNDSKDISKNTTDKTTLDEALQQWSNDNARDIAEDDSTPLRSNL